MNNVIDIEVKQIINKTKELKDFIIELDLICNTLYSRLDRPGIWDVLIQIEDVRVKAYLDYYENRKLVTLRGLNEKK